MIFANASSATTDTVPFAEFWSTVSGSTNIDYYHNIWYWNMLPSEYLWVFPNELIDLPAHEKSIHGKIRGKLKAPKPHCPRGFRHLTLRHEFSGPHFR